MAKVGIKCLTYAKVTGGGDGSAMVYSGGKMLEAYLCKAELKENRSKQQEFADDHQIDGENVLNNVSLLLELANNCESIKMDMLGHEAEGEDLIVTGDDAPFVGVGYITKNRFKGTVTFEPYWVYKIQMGSDGVNAETRKENAQWGHENLSGDGLGVVLTEGGKTYFYAHRDGLESESLAKTWLKNKAGIT